MDNNNNKQNKNGSPNRMVIIITLISALVIWYMFWNFSEHIKDSMNEEITYNEFLKMLDEGTVESVVIKTNNTLSITPKGESGGALDIT